MTRTKTTVAAAFAVLLIGAPALESASAAVRNSYDPVDQRANNACKWPDTWHLAPGPDALKTDVLGVWTDEQLLQMVVSDLRRSSVVRNDRTC